MEKLKLGGIFASTMLAAAQAAAGGLWANEFGDFSGGRASAGAAAGVDDPATLFHNPASGTRLKGSQLFTSVGAFLPSTKFDVEYANPILGFDNGGDAGVVAPGGSLAYLHDLHSDKWSAGVYLGALSGAGLDYNAEWTGRYQATKVSMLLATLAPTVGYKITDRLSVGVSLQLWYSELTQKLNVLTPRPSEPDGKAKLDGDDTGLAYTLGAMYELTDRTRFGLMYQSTLEPNYGGDIELQPLDLEVSSNTELTLAQYARFAMHHDMSEHWSLDFTIGWDNWSELDNLLISSEAGNAGLPTNWHDTYHYAWGAQYRPNKDWSFTGGVSYDTNPVDKKYRVPELPLDRQIRYALGAQYQMRKNLTVGGYVNYADLGKARVATRFFGGDYQENGVLQLMLNANWTF
jgi:long-chain fatty acid transport protein